MFSTPQAKHGRDLAHNWMHVLDVARHPSHRVSYRVPVCRDRVIAAEAEIADLVNRLTEARCPARVAEAAAQILTDGAGPLYNRQAPDDLKDRIREALWAGVSLHAA